MKIWDAETKELGKLYYSNKELFPDIMNELGQLIKTEDANVVLLYARRCLEVIITELCESQLNRPRKTEPLKGIIDKLNSEGKVPPHIISSMLNLNSMATFGTHPKDFDPEQVKPVLNNLAVIIRWYLNFKNPNIINKNHLVPEKSNRKQKKKITLLFIGLSLIISVITIILINIFSNRGKNNLNNQEELEKTIAVMPFRNLSNDSTQAYFCDGFTEEILNNLQRINELTVRSRTSTEQYRSTVKTPETIGKELNVNYLIEGSIGKEANNLKIWVKLINTNINKSIWSNTFTRETEYIFSLQSDIAKEIAVELKTILSPQEIILIDKNPTTNLEAYNYYLLGNDYYHRSYEKQNFENAANMYLKAIELDPNFALAYVRLSLCYSSLHWFDYNPEKDRLTKSKEAIDMALKIDSEIPEAHLALAFYYYWGFLNYSKALNEVSIAQKNLNNNSECFYAKGNIYRRAGEWTLAKESFLKAVELEPSSSLITFGLAETLSLSGEYQEAEKYYNKALLLNPTLIEAIWQKSFMYLKWKGNTIQARETIEEAFQYNECKFNPILIEFNILLDIYDNQFKKALSDLSSNNYDFVNYHLYFNLKPLLDARIYSLLDMHEMANTYFDSARIEIESRILKNPDDPRLYSAQGLAYAGLGQKEKAMNAGRKAVELMPVNREAYRGASRLEDLARIYVSVGEYNLAMEQIRILLKIPSRLSVKLLSLDPAWKPLWEIPEFKKMIKEATS